MPIIKDAISDVLGIEPDWNWSEHLQQASFRGVPFGVISGESVFGRRQAIHEYAYRDQSWIEDMGRSNRRITIKGFLIQDSLVYDAPDVITQRDNLVVACEVGEAGTLVHPTLGEMTVSVTESGLRVSENVESGRVFEFELVVIESGLKVFAITGSEKTGELTFGQWLKEAAHTTLKTIAMIKGEVRSVTQMMKTLKQTADFWVNMVSSSVDEVTNLSNSLNSVFGSNKYGRYQKGSAGGAVSGATGKRIHQGDADDREIIDKTLNQAIIDRQRLDETLSAVSDAASPEDVIAQIQQVFVILITMDGDTGQKMQILNTLSRFRNLEYQQTEQDKRIAALAEMMLVVLAASALSVVSGQSDPTNSTEAAGYQREVCESLDDAMTITGDLALDDIYLTLLNRREQVVIFFTDKGSERGRLSSYVLPSVLPSLNVANRLYQDATRSDELVMEIQPRHPAFVPVRFKALKK